MRRHAKVHGRKAKYLAKNNYKSAVSKANTITSFFIPGLCHPHPVVEHHPMTSTLHQAGLSFRTDWCRTIA